MIGICIAEPASRALHNDQNSHLFGYVRQPHRPMSAIKLSHAPRTQGQAHATLQGDRATNLKHLMMASTIVAGLMPAGALMAQDGDGSQVNVVCVVSE